MPQKSFRRSVRLSLLAAGCCLSHAASADSLLDISGSTLKQKMVFAVYDIRAPDASLAGIQQAALDAIRLYARNASIREGLSPSPYPEVPTRMQLQETGGTPRATCEGALANIGGLDTSMAKYGESTSHRACVFPYAGGYRINYLAIFGQRSGVGSANPGVLAGMMGRLLTNAVGLGDSSKFINTVMDRMESNLKDAGITYKLIEIQPKGQGDRVAEDDDLPKPAQVVPLPVVISANPGPTVMAERPLAPPVITVAQDGNQTLPAHAQLATLMRQQQDAARQQYGVTAQRTLVANSDPSAPSGLAARKELTAIGLQYYSQDQFVEAIRRGDAMAVKLFIAGAAVSTANPDRQGVTPLAAAQTTGRKEILELLANTGEAK
jgi:hypothetical protein